MKHINYRLNDLTVQVNVVEDPGDLPAFHRFVEGHRNALGFDLETTGLDWWGEDFRIRLAQFGDACTSFVLPVEQDGAYRDAVLDAVHRVRKLAMQNGSFDILCMDYAWGQPAEEIFPRLVDSHIIAHLVDSRGLQDGGIGHHLEDLARHYISTSVADEVKGSMTLIARELKVRKRDVWREVPLDHEKYLLYAGMDPVLSYRLVKLLSPRVPHTARRLVEYEHALAAECAYMSRRGIRIDTAYMQAQADNLEAEEKHYKGVAERLGLDNINSPKQVAEALILRGITPEDTTPTGQPKVDDKLLQKHLDDPLCHAVYQGKKAAKAKSTWIDNALNNRDLHDRLHGSINSLAARTGRMSISGSIPAQTFPSDSPYVRRGFIADPGLVVATVDYRAQELRVLAALSGDPDMRRAFQEDRDLHQITADAAGTGRKLGKLTNFLVVYGGGARALMDQAGVTKEVAEKSIRGFHKTFPRVAQYAHALQKEARQHGYITTNTGRRIHVDRKRSYAAINYMVQSSARDVTGRAILRLKKAGFGDWMLIPIHDEILFQFPENQAHQLVQQAAEIMKENLNGVLIDTECSVYGKSWGCGYLPPGEVCDLCETTHQQ